MSTEPPLNFNSAWDNPSHTDETATQVNKIQTAHFTGLDQEIRVIIVLSPSKLSVLILPVLSWNQRLEHVPVLDDQPVLESKHVEDNLRAG